MKNEEIESVCADLIELIDQRQVMLFLGSGSTKACKTRDGKPGLDGNGLAKEILAELSHGKPLDFEVPLMEACEFYSAVKATTRDGLDKFIQKRLGDLQPTIGHYLATTLPWKAIVTTNYNKVIENAWAAGRSKGFTVRDANGNDYELAVIIKDEDIKEHAEYIPSIQFFKPHGCVSIQMQEKNRMVLTSEDYYKSKNLRPQIYATIKSLARECTTLFIGYSLNDYTFRNLFYELNSELKAWTKKSFSVSLDDNAQRFKWRSTAMYENFKLKLINDCFDTFMLRLVKLHGKLAAPLKEELRTNWDGLKTTYPDNMNGLELGNFLTLSNP
jgi:hypothetical protein